jgi:hypothetical protein
MARILVIDDDPDIRFVARLALKRGKHEVTVADSGRGGGGGRGGPPPPGGGWGSSGRI